MTLTPIIEIAAGPGATSTSLPRRSYPAIAGSTVASTGIGTSADFSAGWQALLGSLAPERNVTPNEIPKIASGTGRANDGIVPSTTGGDAPGSETEIALTADDVGAYVLRIRSTKAPDGALRAKLQSRSEDSALTGPHGHTRFPRSKTGNEKLFAFLQSAPAEGNIALTLPHEAASVPVAASQTSAPTILNPKRAETVDSPPLSSQVKASDRFEARADDSQNGSSSAVNTQIVQGGPLVVQSTTQIPKAESASGPAFNPAFDVESTEAKPAVAHPESHRGQPDLPGTPVDRRSDYSESSTFASHEIQQRPLAVVGFNGDGTQSLSAESLDSHTFPELHTATKVDSKDVRRPAAPTEDVSQIAGRAFPSQKIDGDRLWVSLSEDEPLNANPAETAPIATQAAQSTAGDCRATQVAAQTESPLNTNPTSAEHAVVGLNVKTLNKLTSPVATSEHVSSTNPAEVISACMAPELDPDAAIISTTDPAFIHTESSLASTLRVKPGFETTSLYANVKPVPTNSLNHSSITNSSMDAASAPSTALPSNIAPAPRSSQTLSKAAERQSGNERSTSSPQPTLQRAFGDLVPANTATAVIHNPVSSEPDARREGQTPPFTSPSAHDTFAAIDANHSMPATSWVHAGARHAEAGYFDPTLGWVGVRAESSSTAVHAAIVPGSPEAAQALGGHLAGLNAFLAEHQEHTSDVIIGSPEPGLGNGGFNHTEQGSSQNQSRENTPPRDAGIALSNNSSPGRQMERQAHWQTRTTFEDPGVHISVLA